MDHTINQQFRISGLQFEGLLTRSGDGGLYRDVALPAGKAGVLSVRGGYGAGTINTLPTGHGLIATDIVDIHWTGGCRYGVTVDTANANDIIFDDTPAAGGDVLPAQATAVVVTNTVWVDCIFNGDNVSLIAFMADRAVNVRFDTGSAVTLGVRRAAGEPWSWASGQGTANPLTGDAIVYLKATNGASDAATTLKLGVALDATT
jgi:hypothetical protein